MKAAKSGTQDAPTGDVDEETFFARLLNPRGRSTRSQYILDLLAASGAWLLMVMILATILASIPGALDVGGGLLYLLLYLPLMGVYVVLLSFAHIRRLHDRGHSGWLVLLLFVPVVNIIMLLYLLFSPSSWSFAPEDLQKYQSKVTDIVEQVKKEQ